MRKFGILGFGKMGGAFSKGVEDIYGSDNVFVFDASENAAKNAIKCGFVAERSAAALFSKCDVLLLSVKPQDLCNSLKNVSASGKLVISIAAGVKIERLKNLLPGAKIARVMPNTCAQIRKCCSTVAFSEDVQKEDKKEVFAVLNALGGYVEVEESEMNDYLAVSGSFTAYLYLYLKKFAAATAARGVDFDKALILAAKTAVGASEMVLKGDKPVDELISDVCSKGGTTLAGLEKLDVHNFESAIEGCVNACAERAEELGK